METRTFETELTAVIQRTPSIRSFQFKRVEGMDFRAGQFFELILMRAGHRFSKYLSFSNAPSETHCIEFTKRITESEFSRALLDLKPGDTVKMRMPLGSFVLDETSPKHVFLSGGIGITPIRSIWKDAFDRKLGLDMALFYSNRAMEEIAFGDEFQAMTEARKNFRVIYSLDTVEACPVDWKGRCGFIDAAMIREELPDYAERIFYVCGPPGMVKHLLGILKDQLLIPDARIKRESFAGY